MKKQTVKGLGPIGKAKAERRRRRRILGPKVLQRRRSKRASVNPCSQTACKLSCNRTELKCRSTPKSICKTGFRFARQHILDSTQHVSRKLCRVMSSGITSRDMSCYVGKLFHTLLQNDGHTKYLFVHWFDCDQLAA